MAALLNTVDFRVRGRFIRIATLANEWYEDVADPEHVVAEARTHSRSPDILSFIQRPPLSRESPKFNYLCESDHVAAIPVSTFENWWDHQVIKKIRKNVRRSQKYGIVVREVPFSDELVRGILKIYQEVPVRSGRPFRHYRDDFDTCRRKHATFLDQSFFIGAFHEETLVGFIKMVRAGRTGRTMQFICLDAYRDWSPANALLAEAVKVAARLQMTHVVYGKLAYGNKGNAGLEEFKRANGFERLDYNRYFVPLTLSGRLALSFGLHRDLSDRLPAGTVQFLRNVRSRYYARKFPHTVAYKAIPKAAAALD